MSIEALKWAWQQEVTPTEKLVLLVIAEHANSDGASSFPSAERMVKMTGLSRRSIFYTVKNLRRAGLLVQQKAVSKRKHNVYSLLISAEKSQRYHAQVQQLHSSGATRAPYPYLNPHTHTYKATPFPKDFRLSDSNAQLAKKLGIYISGGGETIEAAFEDWALAYGLKSSNWQAAFKKFARKWSRRDLYGARLQ